MVNGKWIEELRNGKAHGISSDDDFLAERGHLLKFTLLRRGDAVTAHRVAEPTIARSVNQRL